MWKHGEDPPESSTKHPKPSLHLALGFASRVLECLYFSLKEDTFGDSPKLGRKANTRLSCWELPNVPRREQTPNDTRGRAVCPNRWDAMPQPPPQLWASV